MLTNCWPQWTFTLRTGVRRENRDSIIDPGGPQIDRGRCDLAYRAVRFA